MKTTIRDLVAGAGYYRIDMRGLLADLRQQPGCERVALRTLADYVAMRTLPRGEVLRGLAAVLCCSIDDIVSARRRGDHE